MTSGLHTLPSDLPIPQDDGAAAHLTGMALPDLTLPATDGTQVNLARLPGRHVIYIYPMTGRPGRALPDGWNEIPGARGCTPQSCSFRNHYAELQALNTGVFGLSTQAIDYQQEAHERLHLPFQLLSDEGLKLKAALVIESRKIVKVFYPAFPPDRRGEAAIEWLTSSAGAAG